MNFINYEDKKTIKEQIQVVVFVNIDVVLFTE